MTCRGEDTAAAADAAAVRPASGTLVGAISAIDALRKLRRYGPNDGYATGSSWAG